MTDTVDQGMKTSWYSVKLGQFSPAKFERSTDGSGVIRDWPVFRAGTFADSSNTVDTWTRDDLRQIVENNQALQSVFARPPVRAGHTRDVDRVKGHTTRLHVNPAYPDFLLADVVLTEPDAVDKFERGTYFNRSAEIGGYQTNSGDVYFPVFLGVAFVDIPAVEGLFSKQAPDEARIFSYLPEASSLMTTTQTTGTSFNFTLNPAEVADTAPAAVTDNGDAQASPVQEPAQPRTFEINGEVLDVEQVAARLEAAKQFEKEQRDSARCRFVNGLIDEDKVAAPQRETFEAFAKTLDSEQFAAWQATFEGAPVLSVLANHTAGTITNPDNDGNADQISQEEKDYQIALETVRMHERSNMPQDELKQTKSWKIVQAHEGRK